MYMDTAENAPALVPKDVTTELGLPADLQAERIFIHKTANYENYIVVQGDRVVAYTPGIEDEEPLTVLELTDGEKVSDISSVGNTIIIATNDSLYYILYKDKEFSFMGKKLPFPIINFDIAEYTPKEIGFSVYSVFEDMGPEEWNEDAANEGGHKNETIKEYLNKAWEAIANANQEAFQDGYFTSSVCIRYCIRLYDGTAISSLPILVNPTSSRKISGSYSYMANTRQTMSAENYKIKVKADFDRNLILNHLDVFDRIEIYISDPIETYANKNISNLQNFRSDPEYLYDYIFDVDITPDKETILLESNALCKKVKEISIRKNGEYNPEIDSLINGFILEYNAVETVELLSGDDMQHYVNAADKLDSYNNQIILVQPSQVIDYDYNRLNSYDNKENPQNTESTTTYDATYLIRTYKEDKVVKKQFVYKNTPSLSEQIYAFQIFPDSRAYKMLVKATIISEGIQDVKYGEFTMRPHPYLDCAYYYGGLENKLVDLCRENTVIDYPTNAVDELDNKLLISEQDDPFTFPLAHRYSFQSKVLGIAIANTALSQGQFGQFPLYVFTEDGIWAMETAADGSFVSQKPLSREVCVNPDSITSIDNAVVFVTNKGVMMIQGSKVMNISPFMNGRHYVPNDSAKSLIAKQDGFAEFESVISDETPFTAFVKKAKVAYDYAGQRLIFMAPKEEYNTNFQYIYKLDTQTWHKISFSDFDLNAPLNSYPECLVLGRTDRKAWSYNLASEICSVLSGYTPNEMLSLLKNDADIYASWKDGDTNKITQLKEKGFIIEEKQTNRLRNAMLYAAVVINPNPTVEEKDKLCKLLNCTLDTLENTILVAENFDWVVNFDEDLFDENIAYLRNFFSFMLEGEDYVGVSVRFTILDHPKARGNSIIDLSTILDSTKKQDTAKGILITRPFDLGMPDVYKSITNIKIRGDYDKGNVKFVLQGSDNGRDFYTLNSLRGKSWKMFRIFILADLEPTERISWIDIDFEPRYNNRLR